MLNRSLFSCRDILLSKWSAFREYKKQLSASSCRKYIGQKDLNRRSAVVMACSALDSLYNSIYTPDLSTKQQTTDHYSLQRSLPDSFSIKCFGSFNSSLFSSYFSNVIVHLFKVQMNSLTHTSQFAKTLGSNSAFTRQLVPDLLPTVITYCNAFNNCSTQP